MVGIKYTDHGLTWERPGIGQMVLYMFVEAVVLFILVLLIEVRLNTRRRLVLRCWPRSKKGTSELCSRRDDCYKTHNYSHCK